MQFLVVDLCLRITLRADAADEVEPREAAAGTNGGVPDLISLASGAANAVGGIVGLSRRADSTAISDQVVAGFALAFAIHPLLVRIAGNNAKS